MSEVKLVINGDASGAQAAVARAQGAVQGMSSSTQLSAAQMAQSMRFLPKQFDDAFRSIAAGQSPMAVLFQQGTQLRDMFGGFGPALRAVATLFTPLSVGVGAVAAAVGAVGYAWMQGARESKEFADALALTGNAAGLTEGQFKRLVRSTADARSAAVGDVREMMQAIVAAGGIAAQTLTETGRAALALAKLNGQSAADNAKVLSAAGDDATAFALKANRAYQFLKASTLEQVMSLQAHGRNADAVRLVMEQLATTLEGRAVRSLGALDRALEGTANWWSKMWAAAKAIGAPETIDDQLAALGQRLDKLRALKKDPTGFAYAWNFMSTPVDQSLDAQIAEVKGDIGVLSSDKRAGDRNARKAAAAQDAEDQKTRDLLLFNARLAVASAQGQRLLATERIWIDARTQAVEQAYRSWTIGAGQYRDAMIAIETSRVDAEIAQAQREVGAQASRKAKTGEDLAARDAAVIQAQTRLAQAQAQRGALQARIDSGAFDAKPRPYPVATQADFRTGELAAQAAAERPRLDATAAAEEAKQRLLETNRTLSAELITDARARAQALLDIDSEAEQRKLALMVGTLEERRQKEEAFAQWKGLREQQLEQDLRPQWQQSLDAWRDNNRLMRESFDNLMDGVLKSGEDMWVQFVTTGKFNLQGFVQMIIAEEARLVFRSFMGSNGGSILGAIGSLFGFGGGRAGGGDVRAGGLYLVGESGPELLRMGAAGGTVVPNAALGGVAMTFPTTISIDARSDQAQIAQLVAGAMAQTQKTMWAQLRARGVT